jgi:cellulose synthase/poly-beta-1,6-N-acetylglucosamine synthase-like glycosyltransferase
MMEVAFWVAVVLLVYPHLLYGPLVAVLGAIRPRPVKRGPHLPPVTVVIPAYDEARDIAATVENKLTQDYPPDKLEVLVVSDASTDGTDEIVGGFASRGVTLLRQEPRRGKAAALNLAAQRAKGDLIVFSDANSLFAPDAVRLLAENFADPEVGYVTGRLVHVGDDGIASTGAGLYMRLENALRRIETRFGSIIGVNGGVDAMRRDLYVDIPEHLISDFLLPLAVVERGRRVVYDSRPSARERPNSEIGREFRMRVRVALRGLQGLVYSRRLLNPLRYPGAAFGLWSHKVLRYTNVLLLPIVLLASASLARVSPFYRAALAVEVAAVAMGLVGLLPHLPRGVRRVAAVPTYVLVTTAAFGWAIVKLLRGEAMATWQPRAG